MDAFLQQTVAGIGTGAIYASLALALVLVYRSTHIVNFAQGEMAMFATYLAWQFHIVWGLGFWITFVLVLGISFLGGMLLERVIIRPLYGSDELTIVIVTIGLFIFFNAAAGFVWTFLIRGFPSPFRGIASPSILGVRVSAHAVGIVVVVVAILAILWLVFQKTKIGLGMRAVAANPDSSRMVGLRVGLMLALGWGLAAAVGTVSGILIAPVIFLDPNMMAGVLIYALASMVLGGIDSPVGALAGGIIVGVSENLAGAYVVGTDLRILVPLAILFVVLMIRPQGLFGVAEVKRA